MLRVAGGELRGRTLASVPGEGTRPPLAKVRAAVANIVAPYVDGARVIDLFSGTGSYSIELLSRGAAWATCIDLAPKAIAVIRKNLESLGLLGCSRVVMGDALSVVRSLESSDEPYQIVLVAPPYFKELDQKAMEMLCKSRLIDPCGIVVLQQHKKETFSEDYGALHLRKTYLYGETRISTYLVR